MKNLKVLNMAERAAGYNIPVVNNGILVIGDQATLNVVTTRKRKEESDSLRRKKIERKRLKRCTQNSRVSTPSSEEETQTSKLNKLALTDENGPSLEQVLTTFHLYSKRLHPLRDNGRWDDFASAIKDLSAQNVGNLPCQIMLRLEESVALSYQNKLEEAEKVMNEAKRTFAQTRGPFRRFCEVLANSNFAGLYRRQKKARKSEGVFRCRKDIFRGLPVQSADCDLALRRR